MATQKPFLQAGFLNHLELLGASAPLIAGVPLPPPLARILLASDGTGALTKAADDLIHLLRARKAMLQASFDTELAADELRRYQKFAKPGQPSPHTIHLRQKQAAARQASSLSKQSLVKAAASFVRNAGIEVPQRVALEVFITDWIDSNVPKAFVLAT
ncbi:hypothetical protein [Rhodanobacter sp. MP1X3]|jgi:hypothetical protein|uniref:hypothetical protein n=1 Tax=Rhodanobacter sp. MP1X3 TaxID=2723086 RepID=UPI001614E511|nr:hypothetical protein [Rhodanobacter sp. MP1X3]MBB6241466.1 hypothetical protein [Rhodanobacter sp. MP1X3]